VSSHRKKIRLPVINKQSLFSTHRQHFTHILTTATLDATGQDGHQNLAITLLQSNTDQAETPRTQMHSADIHITNSLTNNNSKQSNLTTAKSEKYASTQQQQH